MAEPGILVTRPRHQAAGQAALLSRMGGHPIVLPLLEITPVDEGDSGYALLKSRILDLDLYHKIIFVSANAVRTGMELIDQYWPQLPVGIEWLAIGQQTCAQLSHYGISASQPEQGYDSEALLQLPALQSLQDQRILIMRGSGGRELLAQQLTQRGARVDYADLYQRTAPDYTCAEISSTIGNKHVAAALITSGEALHNLDRLIQQQPQLKNLKTALIIVPSSRIARLARPLGYTRVTVANGPDDRSMAEAVLSNLDMDEKQ